MSDNYSPLVSIITPTYNQEKFIGPCIESVLKQTYQNWEQIIIDDGSTDRTAEIIRRYGDPRIRYVSQANLGIEALTETYNRALQHCTGDLVAILEGDDFWPENKLTAQAPAFENPEVILAYGLVADVTPDGTWSGRLSRSARKRMRLNKSILANDPIGSTPRHMLRADGLDLVPACTIVIRRSSLEKIGGFQYAPGLCVTDFPTVLQLGLFGKFHYSCEIMGYRRRHLGSATFRNLARIKAGARSLVDRILQENGFNFSSSEQRAIERTWQRAEYPWEFTAGRLSLLDGEWKGARAHFVRALGPSEPLVFVAAGVGWLLSWFRRDLESLINLAGGTHLQKQQSVD